MIARRPQQRNATFRVAVLVLLAAFVLAQALGWMHRALHGDAGPDRPVAAAVHAVDHGEGEAPGFLDALFGSHAEASDCRLFDAVAQPGCAPSLVQVSAVALPAAVLLASHGDFVARWSALFDARGPPSSR